MLSSITITEDGFYQFQQASNEEVANFIFANDDIIPNEAMDFFSPDKKSFVDWESWMTFMALIGAKIIDGVGTNSFLWRTCIFCDIEVKAFLSEILEKNNVKFKYWALDEKGDLVGAAEVLSKYERVE